MIYLQLLRLAANMFISLPVNNNNSTKIFDWPIPGNGIMLRDLLKNLLVKVCKKNKE